jgi:hypothetical protein
MINSQIYNFVTGLILLVFYIVLTFASNQSTTEVCSDALLLAFILNRFLFDIKSLFLNLWHFIKIIINKCKCCAEKSKSSKKED